MRGALREPGWWMAVTLVALAAAARVVAAWGVHAPWITPDETTYAMLGRSLWATGKLTILGVDGPFYGLVYPAVIGLPLHAFGSADGVRVLQVVQPLLMASTGLVAYGWARTVVAPRLALLACGLTVALPALAYSGLMMTEVAYYPVTTLALWAIARALEQPSLERQAIAVTAILLAALTRLQGLALLPVLIVAVVAAALFERSARIVRRFAATLALTLAAGGVVLAVHQAGASGDVLGAYTATAQTSYELGPALRWIAWHAADVFLLVAGAPLLASVVLAVAAARGREAEPRARALLAVGASAVVVTVLQVGLFASRFAGTLAERNLITVAPPIFIGFSLWLQRGAPRPQPSTAIACLAGAAPALALQTRTLTDPFARPSTLSATPFDHLLHWSSGGWVRGFWIAAVVSVLLLFLLVPRRLAPLLALTSATILVAIAALASVDVQRLSRNLERQLFGGDRTTWVDRAADGPVAYLDGGGHYWNESWLTAFWNQDVDRVASFPDDVAPIPPHVVVSPRFDGTLFSESGQTLQEPYVVAPDRFTLEGTPVRSIAPSTDVGHLTLWRVQPPARLTMLRTGFQPNGDVTGTAEVDVFSCTDGALEVTMLGKDGSQVFVGVAGGRSKHYAPAGGEVVHASIPTPADLGGASRCRFWIETSGLVGTTTIIFRPAG